MTDFTKGYTAPPRTLEESATYLLRWNAGGVLAGLGIIFFLGGLCGYSSWTFWEATKGTFGGLFMMVSAYYLTFGWHRLMYSHPKPLPFQDLLNGPDRYPYGRYKNGMAKFKPRPKK